MLTEQWQLWLVVAAIAANALLVVRTYRLAERREVAAARPPPGDAVVDSEAGVVECPRCRTENEYGYRYCRSCVGELPGPMDFSRAADDPLGRLTR